VDSTERHLLRVAYSIFTLVLLFNRHLPAAQDADLTEKEMTIRVWGLPIPTATDADAQSTRKVISAFYRKHPRIRCEPGTGMKIENKDFDIIPLMQIAGDISPEVIYVNFRQSHTYISQGFLQPLDEWFYKLPEEERNRRVPPPAWPVIKRKGPDGQEHVWALPVRGLVMGLFYRRDLFQEAGLPDRAPEDWNELLEFARKLTNPEKNITGLGVVGGEECSWQFMSFLWSAGAEAVVQDEKGDWRCAFDSDEAATAALMYARLLNEPFQKDGRTINGCAYGDTWAGLYTMKWDRGQVGMVFNYLDEQVIAKDDPEMVGFGPVPRGPTSIDENGVYDCRNGIRGSEYNCAMLGMFAGIKDPARRQAAWDYIHWFDGEEARGIRTKAMVESGFGQFVNPKFLRQFGYTEYLRLVPKGWEDIWNEAQHNGKPEPYGKNCQQVYRYMARPLGQVINDSEVRRNIADKRYDLAQKRIREILKAGVAEANERMIGILTPEERSLRNRVAMGAVIFISVVFVLMMRRVMKTFAPPEMVIGGRGRWQFRRYRWAYVILFPAVGSIALWRYYPLVSGMIIAFQDYRVMGDSPWIGLDNFAAVLWDAQFWYSMWISVKWVVLFMLSAFIAPIILAVLLHEVPRGKIIYRTIYYLPAVITGLIAMFLWKSFYAPEGLMSQAVWVVNKVFGTSFNASRNWLQDPNWALVCCILPVVWFSAGPGCLIYLAALKTVPEDIYEAGDIDGAGPLHKLFHITLPSLKALIIIQFIGTFVGAFQTSEFMFIMTGGGPYSPNGATEVAALQIFYTAFMYLKFGLATAMAWMMAALLIGFTVMQLQRLRNMEFKAEGSKL